MVVKRSMSSAVTVRERDALAPTSGGFQPSATKQRSYPRHRDDAERRPDREEEERIPPPDGVADGREKPDRDHRDGEPDRRLRRHGRPDVVGVGHLGEGG